jgi:hypothetical protein
MCRSMNSLMSRRVSACSSSKRNSASALASSVLPTPLGPRNRNEPMGLPGSRRPMRPRRTAFERAHGLFLADDALREALLHLEELLASPSSILRDGDAGPVGERRRRRRSRRRRATPTSTRPRHGGLLGGGEAALHLGDRARARARRAWRSCCPSSGLSSAACELRQLLHGAPCTAAATPRFAATRASRASPRPWARARRAPSRCARDVLTLSLSSSSGERRRSGRERLERCGSWRRPPRARRRARRACAPRSRRGDRPRCRAARDPHVPLGEPHRRDDRALADAHVVVLLVPRRDAAQDLDRLLGARRVERDGREAPRAPFGSRSLSLRTPSGVVVARRRISPRASSGLSRSPTPAPCTRLARTASRDPRHEAPVRRLTELVEHLLQAALDLAAELRAGHERAGVELEQREPREVRGARPRGRCAWRARG